MGSRAMGAVSWMAGVGALLGACGSDGNVGSAGDARFLTNSVVFGDEANTSYVSLLPDLSSPEIDLSAAREFSGWADVWVHDEHVYIADGEAPLVTKFALRDGQLVERGRISFQGRGAPSAAFWTNLFVSAHKAYLFNIDAREVVIWDPETMEITGSFELPELPDRGAQTLQVPSADRSSVVRGDRAYVPTLWANWDEFSLSEDSVILVIDTKLDKVIDTLSVPCTNLNVATQDDEGAIYFSNWVFSIAATLMQGKPSACAVRIPAGSDQLDAEWSLTFADVTDGREAAALQYLGDGKALMSVFHDERASIDRETDPNELIATANWKFWAIDLETFEASPIDELGWHAGGVYGERVDGQYYLLVPSADYAETVVYQVSSDGSAEERWRTTGWSNRLFSLR
jgi:hypothetical protein